VIYVPRGQLATWSINHVAKISKKNSILEKKLEKF
jgi:hypothetical protein